MKGKPKDFICGHRQAIFAADGKAEKAQIDEKEG